jgi:hypothetical protein
MLTTSKALAGTWFQGLSAPPEQALKSRNRLKTHGSCKVFPMAFR